MGSRLRDGVERMIRGGARKICFVISPDESDIVECFGAGYGVTPIAYVVQPRPSGLCDPIFSPGRSSPRASR